MYSRGLRDAGGADTLWRPAFLFCGGLGAGEGKLEFEPSAGSAGGKIKRLGESLKSRIELINKVSFIFVKTRWYSQSKMKVSDKSTPRLLQSHTLENAVKPPVLGGFFISGVSVA